MKLEKIFENYPDLVCAYKFGSQVGGEVIDSSDLDIAVVHEKPENLNYGKLFLELQDHFKKHPVDLRVINLKSSPSFLFQMLKNNKVLYERNELERINFETQAMLNFYDSQHIRNIYNSYLNQAFN